MLNAITNIPRKDKVDVEHSSRSSSVVSGSSLKHRSPVNKENRKGPARPNAAVPAATASRNGAAVVGAEKVNGTSDLPNNCDEVTAQAGKANTKVSGKSNGKMAPVEVVKSNIIKNGEIEHLSSHSSSATSSTERQKKG